MPHMHLGGQAGLALTGACEVVALWGPGLAMQRRAGMVSWGPGIVVLKGQAHYPWETRHGRTQEI